MKVGEVMKQFKLNIQILLLSEVCVIVGNKRSFTDCVKKLCRASRHLETSLLQTWHDDHYY